MVKAVALTRIHYLGSYLWMAAATNAPELYYHQYTKKPLEIVEVAKALIRRPNESMIEETFAFDTRLVMRMTIVGWNYRHRAARRGVSSKLKRREGIWDSVLSRKNMEWLAN